MANTKQLTRTPDTVYLDPPKYAALCALSDRTLVPRAALYRLAVDMLLEKHNCLPDAPKGAKAKEGRRPK